MRFNLQGKIPFLVSHKRLGLHPDQKRKTPRGVWLSVCDCDAYSDCSASGRDHFARLPHQKVQMPQQHSWSVVTPTFAPALASRQAATPPPAPEPTTH